MWKWIGRVAGAISGCASTAIKGTGVSVAAVGGAVGILAYSAVKIVGAVGSIIGGVIGGVVGLIAETDAYKTAAARVKVAGKAVVDSTKYVAGAVADATKYVATEIASSAKYAANAVVDTAVYVGEKIAETDAYKTAAAGVKVAGKAVVDSTKYVAGAVVDTTKYVASEIASSAKYAANAVVDTAVYVGEKIAETDAYKTAAVRVKVAGKAVVDGTKYVAGAVVDTTKYVASEIASGTQEGFEATNVRDMGISNVTQALTQSIKLVDEQEERLENGIVNFIVKECIPKEYEVEAAVKIGMTAGKYTAIAAPIAGSLASGGLVAGVFGVGVKAAMFATTIAPSMTVVTTIGLTGAAAGGAIAMAVGAGKGVRKAQDEHLDTMSSKEEANNTQQHTNAQGLNKEENDLVEDKQKAEVVEQKNIANTIREIAELCNLANELKNDECYEEALEHNQKAEEKMNHLIDSKSIDISSVNEYLNEIARVYKSIGEYDKLQNLHNKYTSLLSEDTKYDAERERENSKSEYFDNFISSYIPEQEMELVGHSSG